MLRRRGLALFATLTLFAVALAGFAVEANRERTLDKAQRARDEARVNRYDTAAWALYGVAVVAIGTGVAWELLSQADGEAPSQDVGPTVAPWVDRGSGGAVAIFSF